MSEKKTGGICVQRKNHHNPECSAVKISLKTVRRKLVLFLYFSEKQSKIVLKNSQAVDKQRHKNQSSKKKQKTTPLGPIISKQELIKRNKTADGGYAVIETSYLSHNKRMQQINTERV